MNNYQERCYWNNKTYGNAYKVNKRLIQSIIISLGIFIPLILPVPLMALIATKIKQDIIMRY